MDALRALKAIIEAQRKGISQGIVSVCSSQSAVIEAVFRKTPRAVETRTTSPMPVLIESTSNQVNQQGGYTGMKPADFAALVFALADEGGFPRDSIILGGDHLGPHPWRQQNADIAMLQAEELVRQYVAAGFGKIHLDASMPLGGDRSLESVQIAQRSARLCLAAERAFRQRQREISGCSPPVYVIGSEVPTPGGSHSESGRPTVTDVAAFRDTITASREAWEAAGLSDAWERVVAVVVQPGIEFGDYGVHEYRRADFCELASVVSDYSLVYEGHSTDYQTPVALRQMVGDGIAVLKVGPALTFAMREALFLLTHIEQECCLTSVPSGLVDVLDRAMLRDPTHWQGYYSGTPAQIALARKYSLCDRVRYYWAVSEVQRSVNALYENLRQISIPSSLISQFFPSQHRKMRQGHLSPDPEFLVQDRIGDVLDGYFQAVSASSRD